MKYSLPPAVLGLHIRKKTSTRAKSTLPTNTGLTLAKGLKPLYHTGTFREQEKRDGFATIISPVKAGPGASPAEDKAPEPIVPGTIPIHADFLFGATIITKGKIHTWTVRGRDIVRSKQNRKVDVHFPEMGGGKGVIRLGGKAGIDLHEGDGAYVTGVKAGDEIEFELIGST